MYSFNGDAHGIPVIQAESGDGALAVTDQAMARWGKRLQRLWHSLHELAGSSEEEFLSIGARLHDFYNRTGEISRMSGELVALVDSGEIGRGTDGLAGVLRFAENGLGRAENGGQQGHEALRGIGSTLQAVDEPLASFVKINKVLRMLAISTKIESARLVEEASGFDSIANDVTRLAEEISDKSANLIRSKSELDGVIRKSLSTVELLGGEQLQRLRDIVGQIHGGMDNFAVITERFAVAASSVAVVCTDVHRNISDIVASLQFHDITRQKVEHVQEALDALCRRLGDKGPIPAGEEPVEEQFYVEVASVCRLQAAQLRDARNGMISAVAAIMDGLRDISNREGSMCHDLAALGGAGDSAGASFFADMADSLVTIVTSLKESDSSSRHLGETMSGVAGKVEEMASFASHIEQVGEEIELIAINAQVKAARSGDFGAALGVLAESIQSLSENARIQSGTITGALREIISLAKELGSGSGSGDGLFNGKVEDVAGRLDGLLQPLEEVHSAIVSMFSELEGCVATLRHDINDVVAGVTVHQKLAGVLDEVTAELERIDNEVCGFAKSNGWDDFTVCLDVMADRYTMESERLIHATVAGVQTSWESVDAPVGEEMPHLAADGSGKEFGDNVELF